VIKDAEEHKESLSGEESDDESEPYEDVSPLTLNNLTASQIVLDFIRFVYRISDEEDLRKKNGCAWIQKFKDTKIVKGIFEES